MDPGKLKPSKSTTLTPLGCPLQQVTFTPCSRSGPSTDRSSLKWGMCMVVSIGLVFHQLWNFISSFIFEYNTGVRIPLNAQFKLLFPGNRNHKDFFLKKKCYNVLFICTNCMAKITLAFCLK